MGWVDLICLDRPQFDFSDVNDLKDEYNSDVVVFIGNSFALQESKYFRRICIYFDSQPSDLELANSVLRKVVENHCDPYVPYFSVFTPSYKTGDRIYRTYSSLQSQTFNDWEWVVVDDSPQEHTELWEILQNLSRKDHRVKPFRISPNSSGSVGKVKKRACSLSKGEWLVELDHDDELMPECLSTISEAIDRFSRCWIYLQRLY